MQTYDFEMTQDGLTVAKGTCSAVMLYEFQKTFIDTIGCRIKSNTGSFPELLSILSAPVDSTDCWKVESVDGKAFGFWFQRIN